MIRAAFAAAKGLKRDFGEVEHLQVSAKGPADFVSRADIMAEKTLRAELSRTRPEYGFLGEEGGETKGDGRNRWIADPLDGTTNFLHGVPHFAISLALERDGEIIAGVIYQPISDELFWAEKGNGAFVDTPNARSRRLRVSGRKILGQALIGKLIAEIADKVGDLTVFQRRPNWSAPLNNSLISEQEMADIRTQAMGTMTTLLAGIAGVSLIVGGIGIMNIMLVSVTERTREIGLRMAIGAKARDVLLQFLVEAIALSLIGGGIGIALGFGIAQGMERWMSWPAKVPPNAVGMAFGFAAAVGVFFGFYPARKAARLDPIEALRYE